jgi:nicotinamide N-methyltransferase
VRCDAQANTLLADHLFSPSLVLAERIERGLIDLNGKTRTLFYFTS